MGRLKEWMGKVKGRRRLAGIIGVAVVLALVATGFGLDVNIGGRTERDQRAMFTIGGQEGVIVICHVANAAPVADYVCDGVADDVQFQAALDALPATGGQLYVLGGTYTFAATVTRAIDNVTIEGIGRGAFFQNDGVTALFSVGAQSNWCLRNFRTDAGGVTLAGGADYTLENVLLGATYYGYFTPGNYQFESGTAFAVTLDHAATAARTITVPDATDTMVCRATTDTLSNKTLAAGNTVANGLTWSAAQNLNNQALTNVNIDSGDVSAMTVSGGLTWNSAQNLNNQALTNVNIDSGDVSAMTVSGGLTWNSAQDLNSQALTNINIDSGTAANLQLDGLLDANSQDIDNIGNLDSGASILVRPSGDLDDYFTVATVGDIPTIYGTGSYSRFGDAGVTTHGLASEDDLLVTGVLEVDSSAWLDAGLIVTSIDFSSTLSAQATNIRFNSQNADGTFLWFAARDTGNTVIEVGRLQGAADPYFGLCGSQEWRYYNSGICETIEIGAPGAGAADTVRIYAVEGPGALTDLCAVFQDGTVDIFAQELTPLDAPILTYPSNTPLLLILKKPHPGLMQYVLVFPGGEEFVLRTVEYHDVNKIAANQGAEGPLPDGWEVTTAEERAQ